MEATSTPQNPLASEGTFKQRMKYRILLGAVQGDFVLIGCYLAWTSTGLFFLRDSKIIYSPQQASWVGSFFPLGAVLGTLPIGILTDKYGRKFTTWFSIVPMFVGWFIICWMKYYVWTYVARFVAGIGAGAASVVIPIYYNEIANENHRRNVVMNLYSSILFGFFFVYVVDSMGPFKEPTIMMLALMASYPLLLLFTVPESPVWLTARGRKEEAERGLKKLMVNYVNLDSTESVKPLTSAGLQVEVLQRMENKGKLFLIMSLIILQQVCGIGPITFYANDIIGIITKHHIYSWVFVIAMALLWILVPVVNQILVKRLGEKCLLMISTFLMAVFLFLLAGYTISARSPNPILISEVVALALLLIYMAAFHVGMGPVPWILIGKLFPGKVKKTIYNLALTCGWATLFITTKTFYDMLIVMDIYVLLIIYASVSVISMFFVAFAVPRIIDEIDEGIATDLNEIRRL